MDTTYTHKLEFVWILFYCLIFSQLLWVCKYLCWVELDLFSWQGQPWQVSE